jgi:hypothetical protein
MEAVVAPVLQAYELPPLAVNTVLPPTQISKSPDITGAADGLTVTVREVDAEQPLAFVAVTV